MSRFALILPAVIAISACGSSDFDYSYRPSTTLAEKAEDLLYCRISSENMVPQKLEIYSSPAKTYCSNYGGYVNCKSYGGTVESYDANSSLRLDVLGQCMANKGYRYQLVPECQKSVIPENAESLLGGSVRAPVDGACAVRFGSSSNRVANLLYPNEFRK